MPYRVVLTGGIASGKSVASAHFEHLGIAVIDADQVSRKLVQPGQPALARIAARFGNEMLLDDGQLDRRALRDKVFAAPSQRQALEAILHPLIHQRMLLLTSQATSPYVVLVVPLLLESQQDYPCERVLVIDVPPELQRQRLMQRDGSNPAQVAQILAAQTAREKRLAMADDVICNDGTLEQLQRKVEQLNQRYLELAAESRPESPSGHQR